MKILILQFIFFSMLYFIFESIFNRITIGNIIEKKLKKNSMSLFAYASIWMIPVGGLVGIIMNLFFLIPIFSNIKFLPLIMIIGCIVINAIEFLSGYILNIKLKLNIWDYSGSKIKIFNKEIPLNLMGQIDIYHAFGWFLITLPIYFFSDLIKWLAK